MDSQAAESEKDGNDKQIIELHNLKLDWYEKDTDRVIVHLYVRDVTACAISVPEERSESVKVTFSTSNAAFIEKYCKGKERDSVGGNMEFLYRINPYGKVSKNGSSCQAKKALIDICLQKVLPVTWKSLERKEVTMARQIGTLTQGNGGEQPHTATDVKDGPCSSSLEENITPNVTLYGRFPPQYPPKEQPQLLGGKSTPITKGEGNKDNREEASASADDQQPSCSKVDPEGSSSSMNRQLSVRSEALGFNGLENFANNCYMNVVVQVLANLIEIKDYFGSDNYLQFLNVANPLGSGGKVAKAFSDLIKLLWTTGKKSHRPSILKNIMGKRCSLFLGLQQCDAQEFFSSLLDNLHEDLNQGKLDRAAEYSSKETDGPTVNERSDTAWQAHVVRNSSIIVKMFHGQLVSKLTCASCHKVSHSFDPCAQISLPIAMEKKVFHVILFYKDPKKTPIQLRVQISTLNAQVWHLINMVSRKVDIPSHFLKAFPVVDGLYQPSMNEHAPLRPMLDKKYLVVCETRGIDEDYVSVPVLQHVTGQFEFHKCSYCGKSQDALTTKLKRCTRCSAVAYCGRDCQCKHWAVHKAECRKDAKLQFGLPFVITLKKSSASFNTLKETLLNYAYYSVKDELCDEAQEKANSKEPGNSVRDNSEGVEDMTQNTATASAADWPECSSSDFIIRAYSRGKADNEAIVLKHDDFKIERLSSFSFLSLDWVISQGGDEKVSTLKERVPPVFNALDASPLEEKLDVDKCSLDDCLSLFMEPERLSESESWRCPKCKTPQAARKEMSISYPPPILLLHLKRFTFGEVGQKVSKPIHYRVSGFDLSPYVFEETRALAPVPYLYDLVGVICHKGSLRMGHYVCMARLLDQNDAEDIGWRFIDDDEVSRVREEKIISPEAYVLIYRLRGLNQHLNVERNILAPPSVLEELNTPGGRRGSLKSASAESDAEQGAEGSSNATDALRNVNTNARFPAFKRQCSEDTESRTAGRNEHETGAFYRSPSYTEDGTRSSHQSKPLRNLPAEEHRASMGTNFTTRTRSEQETRLVDETIFASDSISEKTTGGMRKTNSNSCDDDDDIFMDCAEEEIFSDCFEHNPDVAGPVEQSDGDKIDLTGGVSPKEATILNRVSIEEDITSTSVPKPTSSQVDVTEDDLD